MKKKRKINDTSFNTASETIENVKSYPGIELASTGCMKMAQANLSDKVSAVEYQ